MEKERGALVKFTEEKNNEILHYNNKLAQLQTRLDRAQSEAVKWYVVCLFVCFCFCWDDFLDKATPSYGYAIHNPIHVSPGVLLFFQTHIFFKDLLTNPCVLFVPQMRYKRYTNK